MPNNQNNLLLAAILSAIIIIGWTWLYEKPRMEEYQKQQAEIQKTQPTPDSINNLEQQPIAQKQQSTITEEPAPISSNLIDRDKAIKATGLERVEILGKKLRGSIYLKGARFDDIILNNYRQSIDADSKKVALLSPFESDERYFADFGWVSSDLDLELPKSSTIWSANNYYLSDESPLTLTWKNSQNIQFNIYIAIDENYMFSVTQSVTNLSKQEITVASYGRISRILNDAGKSNYILHQGAIGVFNDILTETTYKDLAEENNQVFEAQEGWFGITDKYWLTSIIPDKKAAFNGRFTHIKENQNDIYGAEFVGQEFSVSPSAELEFEHHFFSGAKEVVLLDKYGDQYDIHLFDRAVDFGWFYFLTKPFFFILRSLNSLLGNYGLAILAMTVLIKAALFPLANKSYGAMGKIKQLAPKITQIREDHKSDKMQMNKEIMELYKREKVNPASGCLPMLIQIPIFFSLYKVLFVTIDMRHQPFYGWIKDLSAPDPTSIFNLFGLLPFEVSGILAIGIWPILMGLTMVLQQKLGPKVSDPAQAKVMQILPFILIFVFAAFPAGLLIYWTWSNILSITQQWFITNKLNKSSE
ncbi:MAG: membrane protein insertase YidC [Proteobacteria bacterium]|nr:membrane protein insertase YidC [Pseudomonadota bacterium]